MEMVVCRSESGPSRHGRSASCSGNDPIVRRTRNRRFDASGIYRGPGGPLVRQRDDVAICLRTALHLRLRRPGLRPPDDRQEKRQRRGSTRVAMIQIQLLETALLLGLYVLLAGGYALTYTLAWMWHRSGFRTAAIALYGMHGLVAAGVVFWAPLWLGRSEEHTSELQ